MTLQKEVKKKLLLLHIVYYDDVDVDQDELVKEKD